MEKCKKTEQMNLVQDQIACFSSGEKPIDDMAVTRSSQSVFMSIYRTKIADQCRLISLTWCKNGLQRGLSVSIEGPEGENQFNCKFELKPWNFWRKQGSKHLIIDEKRVDIFWDLKSAKFEGETEPKTEYYVAIVCDDEVVLLIGDLKKEAYRRTKCRPSLIDPILVSKREHIFGKLKFVTKMKFHEKGRVHEISVDLKNRGNLGNSGEAEPEMEIRIDGHLGIHIRNLQWKFRGNEIIKMNRVRIEVYWDVHDWLFSPGLRNGLFIFKPSVLTNSPSSISSSPPPLSLSSTPLSSQTGSSVSAEGGFGGSDFCLFLYAWKIE